MAAAKDVLLDCLSPKHHDQWEFAALKCFQLGFKKISKVRKGEDESYNGQSKYSDLLRRVARLYITSKQDGVPRDQLHAICAVVNTSVSLDEWNDLLKEVQLEIAMEKQQQAMQSASMSHSNVVGSNDSHVLLDQQGRDDEGLGGLGATLLPPPPSLPEQQAQEHHLQQQEAQLHQEHALSTDTQPPVKVSWRAWQLSKEDAMSANASASRLHDRECERRCKAYDSNKAISTAIRLVEGSSRRGDGEINETIAPPTHDPMALVIQNRLGYQSAQLFADKLDIMQKIIKAYREAENNDEKDFLLGLVSGSFTRDEVNRIVVPPEAQVMLPGRVRNTALISGHKWTFIRKAAGCPTVNPKHDNQKYAEGVKKRKRTIEEQRLLAVTSSYGNENTHHLMPMNLASHHTGDHDHPHSHSHVNEVTHSTSI
jgi:hypothetical protein